MQNNKSQEIQYYLFSFSNLIAAIGGGMILGKGVDIINVSWLQSSSLLAFFVGTVFGLVFLQMIPKKWEEQVARLFSFFGGITSFILCGIFIEFQNSGKISGEMAIVFFSLLSLRFGFWFYSRVLRAANASGKEQRIAWVELGYYSGIVIGLILWNFLGIDIGMSFALILDGILQIIAGISDLLANSIFKQPAAITPKQNTDHIMLSSKNTVWLWRLAISVMFLTIGVQVIIFKLAHLVTHELSSYILAVFYFGAAASAFFCKKFKISLEWHSNKNRLGYAAIFLVNKKNKYLVSFLVGAIISALCVCLVVFDIIHFNPTNNFQSVINKNSLWLLFFVFLSTFIYGILELAILDRIGFEEQFISQKGMVTKAYGIMSVGAVIGLWILGIVQQLQLGLFCIAIFSFILTVFPILRRNLE